MRTLTRENGELHITFRCDDERRHVLRKRIRDDLAIYGLHWSKVRSKSDGQFDRASVHPEPDAIKAALAIAQEFLFELIDTEASQRIFSEKGRK